MTKPAFDPEFKVLRAYRTHQRARSRCLLDFPVSASGLLPLFPFVSFSCEISLHRRSSVTEAIPLLFFLASDSFGPDCAF